MGMASKLAALSGSYGTGGFVGMKNRIINGAMAIDQRNAGASVPATNTAPFVMDRWSIRNNSGGGEFTGQQVAAPTGSQYIKALKLTVTTVDSSIAAGEYYVFRTKIEGFNIADFLWGTASAKTITLSFEVTSSVTGTFSVAVCNYNDSRSYVAPFTVSSANTPEVKTITILGDTSGTWYSDNGIGIDLLFNVGMGSTYTTASTNSWQAGTYYAASGQTNLIATSGATLQITGVQLEKGSTATSFDYRPYGTELALCQRYAVKYSGCMIGTSINTDTPYNYANLIFAVPMRATPTLAAGATFSATSGNAGTPALFLPSPHSTGFYNTSNNWSVGATFSFNGVLSSEL